MSRHAVSRKGHEGVRTVPAFSMGRISRSQERVYVPENELKEGRARLVAYSPHGSANQIGKVILHIKGFSLETDNTRVSTLSIHCCIDNALIHASADSN